MKALHQIEKKGCEALLCAHTAKQKHHAVLAHDFTAHDLVNVVLQCRDFARQLFDAIERHDTHFGVFERDGMLSGLNLSLYRDIAVAFPSLAVQASGGVATLDDVRGAKASGAGGAVLGKALLEGRFTLPEAFAC